MKEIEPVIYPDTLRSTRTNFLQKDERTANRMGVDSSTELFLVVEDAKVVQPCGD